MKTRRMMALLCTATMLLSLAACGGKKIAKVNHRVMQQAFQPQKGKKRLAKV